MLTRILTSVIGVVVFFAALFGPPPCFQIAVLVVTAVMLYEMYSVLKCGLCVNTIGFLSALVLMLGRVNTGGIYFSEALIIVFMLYLITTVFMHTKKKASEVLSHGFITAYLSIFMSYIIRTSLEFGALGALWVFVIAWITDSGAYFVGVTMGKHKIAPHISPKKSVEGSIGGVVVTVICAAVYYFIIVKVGAQFDTRVLLSFMAMGLVGSVLSQLGDFVASAVKRDSGIKDYGSILPGHGGLMDRFDSVVFIAPFVYYVMALINHFLPL